MHARLLGSILLVALFLAVSGAAQTAPESDAKPISQQGLTEALRIGGLSTPELIQIIEKRGVAFQLTSEVEHSLIAAGATSPLLAAVRAHYRPPASVQPAPTTPTPAPVPLSKNEIITLLNAGAPLPRIEQIVKDRKVSFEVTPEVSRELAQAGANDKLLAAITANSPKVSPPNTAPAPAPASGPRLASMKEVHKLFIEKMDNNLDEYLRAEFSKQMPGRFVIVLNQEDADAFLVGSNQQKTGIGAVVTGRYLGLHDTATGAVSIVDKAGTVLWASEAGDRSLLLGPIKRGGPRKVADRLVHNLKKSME